MKKMKSMNDSRSNNKSGNNINSSRNWLGFSLSPHMKMEVTSSPPLHHHDYHHYNHQPQVSTAAISSSVLTTFCLSPSQLNSYRICYSAVKNPGYHSPLTAMPFKSDGSLCIMEALSRSQTQVMMPNSSLKLEDFLGGAIMGTHDVMALSLNSIYYGNQAA
ncbi:AP2-like ethylene-responsive transcription factor CRL5 [Prosopis cineraria]|uniref:AP2-like ethylene-responsive transcription factor CRL5 n=1 Tax=Prosopis cineraria TaxID=364024 RepID=UPI002410613A|nr:AP2-like ethylene-responsive transcription factor CRL5 [Prosopis cineraria]